MLDKIAEALKHFEATVKPVDEIQSYLRDVPVLTSIAAHERSLEVEPRAVAQSVSGDDDDEVNLKGSSDSLTSSPVFFWGVPLIAVAAIGATAIFLYKRQNK
jgi:hypothetical protein